MDNRFGKLTLLNPNGPEQEFELAKPSVSLGRSTTNDITLDDARVSRSHARLDGGAEGVTLVDLGSSNGTRVNGIRVERTTLRPGDTINLGRQHLRYSVDGPSEEAGLTVIDNNLQLEQTIRDEYLPVVLNETERPGLVVFSGDRTWRINFDDLEQVAIGRDENCAAFVDAENVSRRHAEVRRQGEAYVLRDFGSTNGTWVRGRQIDEYILQDGDAFRIGPAQLVFKQGFQEQELTMAEEHLSARQGRRTVVFVPGLMGSELWLGNERIWPSVKTLFTNPEIFVYPSENHLEPRGIVDEVVIVPNLIKQDQYNRLGDYLVEELKFRRDEDYFEFPYDWRQDVRTSARQLGEMIEGIHSQQPLVIIGHSLGTMVTRYYVDVLGGDKRVERIILMGGPHKGAVKGLVSMLVAPGVLPFGIMGERLREIVLTFPSSYQILPDYEVGTDQRGAGINFLEDDSWLQPEYHPLLKLGKDFRKELGQAESVPSVSIFGYGIKTISRVSIKRDEAGGVQDVSYLTENVGDGSILEKSAYLPGSEIHPVRQHHGALFVDNDVKMRLKIELMRPY